MYVFEKSDEVIRRIPAPRRLQMMNRAGIFVIVLLGACSRSSNAPSGPSSSASALGGPAPSASGAPAPSGSAFDARGAPQVFARLKAWNDALDSHSVAGLSALYFSHVCYYGHVVPIDKLLKQKKDTLGAGSSFQQQIVGAVRLEQAPGDVVVARFTKRSGAAQRLRDTPARIVLRQDTGHGELRILEEADDGVQGGGAAVDACAQSAWSEVTRQRCEETASRRVNELPRVKKLVDELLKASTDDRALGGIGPEDNGDGTFTASIGIHTQDRFEGRVDYTVHRTTGHLAVKIDDTDVPVPESAQHELANACMP
jgi:hypothetical protein